MPIHLTRRTMIAAGLSACATATYSATRAYELVQDRSSVAFRFDTNGVEQNGTVPVRTADIQIDTRNLTRSTADVTADVRKAKTGFIFVTQALLSDGVLDAKNHPIVRFRSTKVRLGAKGRISEGAVIEGDLTLRGVTLPIALNAQLSRPAGTAPDDLSYLFVQLDGTLNRFDFGATGYAKMVADQVRLDIRAELRQT